MKTSRLFIISLAVTFFSTSAFSAEQIRCFDALSLTKVAVISSSGTNSPNDLIKALSDKAEKIGASKFRVISIDSKDRATAIAYK